MIVYRNVISRKIVGDHCEYNSINRLKSHDSTSNRVNLANHVPVHAPARAGKDPKPRGSFARRSQVGVELYRN